jgi:hypothetical protein
MPFPGPETPLPATIAVCMSPKVALRKIVPPAASQHASTTYQALTPTFNDLHGRSTTYAAESFRDRFNKPKANGTEAEQAKEWQTNSVRYTPLDGRLLVGRLCCRGDEVQQLFHVGLFVEGLQFKGNSHPKAGMSRLHRTPQMQF